MKMQGGDLCIVSAPHPVRWRETLLERLGKKRDISEAYGSQVGARLRRRAVVCGVCLVSVVAVDKRAQ